MKILSTVTVRRGEEMARPGDDAAWHGDQRTRFAVEQLEPKILLSAAPVDAPSSCCGVSDNLFVSDDESGQDWTSDEVEVLESEVWSDPEQEESSDNLLLDAGEVIDWSFDSETASQRDTGTEHVDINDLERVESWVVEDGQRLKGSGTFEGELVNEGTLAPGNSPGETRFDRFENEGTLQIEIAGTAESNFDRVIVAQDAVLDGALEVVLLDGFVPAAGDEFEFLTFASSEGDFSQIAGLQISDTRYFVPIKSDGGYKLRVVDVGAVPVALLDGDFRFDSGIDAVNQQLLDVLSGTQDLSLLQEQSLFGTFEAGGLEISGEFAIGQDGTYAFFLMESGSVLVSGGESGIFDGSEAGFRLSGARLAVIYDPVTQSFAITGSGELSAYGGEIDLGGTLEVAWSNLGTNLINREFSASGVSQTVTVVDDTANLHGRFVSAYLEGAHLQFDFGLALQTGTASALSVTVDHGSLKFTDSGRANVKIEEVSGIFTVDGDQDFSLLLDGRINAAFSGFSISDLPVTVSYSESGTEGARVSVSGSRKVGGFLLADIRMAGDFVLDITENPGNSVPEILFAFSEVSFLSSIANLTGGSGVIIAGVEGVAAQIFGTATGEAGGFSAGGRIQFRVNTTGREIDEVVPFEEGSVHVTFGPGETGTNFSEVVSLTAFLEIGEFLQVRGPLSWTTTTLELDGNPEPLEVRTIADDSLEIFLGASELVPGVWGRDVGATGFFFGDAELAVIHFVEEDTYALTASGTALASSAGTGSMAGTGTLTFNQSGLIIDETIEFLGQPGVGLRISFLDNSTDIALDIDQLEIEVSGQNLQASARVTVGSDRLEVDLQELSATFNLGSGTLGFAGAEGEFFLGNDQAYGSVTGSIVQNGLDFLSLSGSLGLDFNTGEAPGELRSGEVLPGGPLVRLSGRNLTLTVDGESLTGSFTFENGSLDGTNGELSAGPAGPGETPVLLVQADQVGLSTNGLTGPEMDFEGVLVLSQDWLAGQLAGTFNYTEPDVTVAGTVGLVLNTSTQAIRIPAEAGSVAVDVEAGPGVVITADDFVADLQAGTIMGSFSLFTEMVEGMAALRFDVADLDLRFGGTLDDPLVALGVSSGLFYITSEGLLGSISGLRIDAGSLSFSGTPSYSFNTTSITWSGIDPGVFRLGAPELTFTVGDFSFLGNIDLSLPSEFNRDLLQDQYPRPPGFDGLQIAFSGVNLDLPGGAGSVTDINGALFAVDGGILGQLAADLDLSTSDLALSGSSALAFNSTASAFQGTLNAGDSSVPVDVPAGPYFAFGLTDLD